MFQLVSQRSDRLRSNRLQKNNTSYFVLFNENITKIRMAVIDRVLKYTIHELCAAKVFFFKRYIYCAESRKRLGKTRHIASIFEMNL